ncbi:Radical SAM family enzyme, similar to coproporphyrinogen III oxidase, oxygen-independent, clustered with nucleoside-triphosphatase RdgB [hydrothermal vent metagenome]|uniref:Radical SAM family enzyme, similar to coproporphyrinogen III oxidase, oxygen-independent, clustered with nucleoside-triphosphatase RdgB n=1 Tax=hydrothermal vent metagenome TaxID=652676 RepID=A0A3B0X3V2_9ZZZZ
MPEFTTLPPLALYIHLPWCAKKCPYCDFNSHTCGQNLPEQEYLNALISDLEAQLPTIWGRRIISVFIGGGTPSLFSAESIHKLMTLIRSHLNCLPTMEVTMEANPGSVEQGKFNDFFAAGINRLSIGVQSFDEQKLQSLGRIHSAAEAYKAIDVARNAGFENINIDLMFALPEQTTKQGLDDLQQAINLSPEHISWYQLTIEPNTLFYNHPPHTPNDDESWEMQKQGQQLLHSAGYLQYEISAYAQKNRKCEHNINYWQFGDYLALGAGAHGKISRSDTAEINRYRQIRQPAAYMQNINKTSGSEILQPEQIVFEFMLNALRLKQGFDIQIFEQHSGLKVDTISGRCEQAIKDGMLLKQNNRYYASEQGYLFLNDLINRFS